MSRSLLAALVFAAGCHLVSGLSDFGTDEGAGGQGVGGMETGSVTTTTTSATGTSSSSGGRGGGGMGGGGTGGGPTGYPAVVLADEPLVYWRLGDPPGSLPYDEVSRGPLGGYENGAVLGEPGVLPDDDSVYFGGTSRLALDDGVLPIDFAGKEPFSIEVWVKLTAYPSNPERGIMYKQDGQQGNEHGWRLGIRTDGRFRFVRRLDGDNDDCFSNGQTPLDTWVHVVGTFDGTIQRLYLDGQQHDQTNAQRSILDTGARFTLASVYGSQNAFDGWLDEVAIYDRALTQQAIADHYTSGKPE